MKFSSEKALDKRKSIGYNYVRSIKIWSLYGGIAQLARAFGSYPKCRWFKSDCRYHVLPHTAKHPGPVVKRLRHRPFTAVTRVRFSSGSPESGREALPSVLIFPGKDFRSRPCRPEAGNRRKKSTKRKSTAIPRDRRAFFFSGIIRIRRNRFRCRPRCCTRCAP